MKKVFTISKSAEGLYKEKGSKFISYIFPVQSEEDVKDHLAEVKTEHPKSRHVCYAFKIGQDGELERANDAGEPNGSAGLPILNQLHSSEITNALLVVVRYFGGTKLGISGLITAYKEAAKSAIDAAIIEVFVAKRTITLKFDMKNVGMVERIIRQEKVDLINSDYSLQCVFIISVMEQKYEEVRQIFYTIPGIEVV